MSSLRVIIQNVEASTKFHHAKNHTGDLQIQRRMPIPPCHIWMIKKPCKTILGLTNFASDLLVNHKFWPYLIYLSLLCIILYTYTYIYLETQMTTVLIGKGLFWKVEAPKWKTFTGSRYTSIIFAGNWGSKPPLWFYSNWSLRGNGEVISQALWMLWLQWESFVNTHRFSWTIVDFSMRMVIFYGKVV